MEASGYTCCYQNKITRRQQIKWTTKYFWRTCTILKQIESWQSEQNCHFQLCVQKVQEWEIPKMTKYKATIMFSNPSAEKFIETSLWSMMIILACIIFIIRKVNISFGFFQLIRAEQNGTDVAKSIFELEKNSLLYKWSQVSNILSVMNKHEPEFSDRLRKLISKCNKIF